ncbi:unnamed protein product [Prorocentrum cordatum]|uniref:Uncharacterized protein n=1 Tax=Prorocentrum cordatum TaxID=2364126 RepID=A0ABN9TZ80_9DINO|nr:unnamed protein product [Polarella glacialis]
MERRRREQLRARAVFFAEICGHACGPKWRRAARRCSGAPPRIERAMCPFSRKGWKAHSAMWHPSSMLFEHPHARVSASCYDLASGFAVLPAAVSRGRAACWAALWSTQASRASEWAVATQGALPTAASASAPPLAFWDDSIAAASVSIMNAAPVAHAPWERVYSSASGCFCSFHQVPKAGRLVVVFRGEAAHEPRCNSRSPGGRASISPLWRAP